MPPTSGNSDQQALLASQRLKMTNEDPSKSAYFPLGYKAAAWQWWTSITPAVAEQNVLSHIPFVKQFSSHINLESQKLNPEVTDVDRKKDPHGPRVWYSRMVTLSGNDRVLNEFSVERVDEKTEQNLVMLHGYGAGLGFFYKNFEGLSRVKGWKIYALDMLGMGRSSRPPFKIYAKDLAGKIKEAENWFIDALEEWRIQKNIEKFTLLGHSMGGYMAVAYALKYPGHLNKLILASPVGIPEDPYAIDENTAGPKESALTQEFTQSQDETTRSKESSLNNQKEEINLQAQSPEQLAKEKSTAPPRRKLPKWFAYLWDANISPFSVIRWTGPLGPRIVSGWSSRRFSHLPDDESEALHEYAYTLFRQRGSGEYALSYVLAPGAFARHPLIKRIHLVGRQELPAKTPSDNSDQSSTSNTLCKETGIPIIFMYGENDWMDVAGGLAAEHKLKEEQKRILQMASEEERRKESGSSKVVIVKNAGHHLYLDGWEEFNEIIRKELEETSSQGKLGKDSL